MSAVRKFKYVYIPANNDPMEEREFEGTCELEDDHFIKNAKQYFASVGKADKDVLLKNMSHHAKKDLTSEIDAGMQMAMMNISSLDIFPIAVPTKATDFLAVSLYCDDKGVSKDLPVNTRAVGLAQAAGYPGQAFRGDVFISRVFDDEDAWERRDFTVADCSSEAPWLKQCRENREKTGANTAQGLSQMKQAMAGGQPAEGEAAPQVQMPGAGGAVGDMSMLMGNENEQGSGDGYKWTQTGDEVEVELDAEECSKADVKVVFTRNNLNVNIKGKQVLDGKLCSTIDVDCSAWIISGGKVSLTLSKDPEKAWKSLMA